MATRRHILIREVLMVPWARTNPCGLAAFAHWLGIKPQPVVMGPCVARKTVAGPSGGMNASPAPSGCSPSGYMV